MTKHIFYRNYNKFANQQKKNQLKILSRLKYMDFTKLKLFC